MLSTLGHLRPITTICYSRRHGKDAIAPFFPVSFRFAAQIHLLKNEHFLPNTSTLPIRKLSLAKKRIPGPASADTIPGETRRVNGRSSTTIRGMYS